MTQYSISQAFQNPAALVSQFFTHCNIVANLVFHDLQVISVFPIDAIRFDASDHVQNVAFQEIFLTSFESALYMYIHLAITTMLMKD